ncbi:hypothetical protein DL766_001110 [Monosporascus sp. MC13-8B]|uniref:TLC domain-containing protein n=1 Tax=Monosporascus cannonballus TaxID=155416 RepID=A0ABY0H7F0_9PEZI|nr:hypothetical protein DL762_004533 [Monosporascus cannonballus]RYO90532.1 hypothetical protein DL763_005297 [Monosporascus cannonballus]RYP38200.1 hypothetical protein DL766_001110 [Monosporascus sp. MC13-8B]
MEQETEMRQSMGAPRYKTKVVKSRVRSVKDTVIANKAGSPPNLTQWLLDNQTGVCFGLIASLYLTHICIPNAPSYTSKFLTLSYYNGKTGKYTAGYDDFFFVTFLTVLLMGLRAACMEYILVPLAKRWDISTRKEAIRFSEQGWMLTYYGVLWPLGLYIYYTSPYFLNMEELWTNWPQRELDGLMKGYILVQWAFWSQQVLVIHIETRRKDYWQILTHHFVTIALIAASYAYHHTRVGHVILVLMDVIELIFPLAKCLKYLGLTTACDVAFGVFMITWFISRHVFYPMVCWSIYSDPPRLLRSACYRGTADNLQGPFPVPDGWSHLLDPFRDPSGTVCSNDNIIFGFLCYLLLLQVIMVMWFVLIVRVAIRVLRGSGAEDVRSDDEMEVDAEHLVGQPIEEEVGVEDIDLKQWERRTGVKGATSSTAISLSRQGDRKELWNRIGCEKQID